MPFDSKTSSRTVERNEAVQPRESKRTRSLPLNSRDVSTLHKKSSHTVVAYIPSNALKYIIFTWQFFVRLAVSYSVCSCYAYYAQSYKSSISLILRFIPFRLLFVGGRALANAPYSRLNLNSREKETHFRGDTPFAQWQCVSVFMLIKVESFKAIQWKQHLYAGKSSRFLFACLFWSSFNI